MKRCSFLIGKHRVLGKVGGQCTGFQPEHEYLGSAAPAQLQWRGDVEMTPHRSAGSQTKLFRSLSEESEPVNRPSRVSYLL